jgi:two-component system, NtrC family, sensor kinase
MLRSMGTAEAQGREGAPGLTKSGPPIRFLTYPLLGEPREYVRAEFFGRALSRRVGRPVVVEQARSYEFVEVELEADRVDMVLATAEQCDHFEASARATLRALRAGRWYYHAALICRAEEPLTLEKLRGLRAAWVDPRSTGGHLLARRYLESLGMPPSELFAEQAFYGTYRHALLAVLAGKADVASQITTHADEYTTRARMAERIGAEERQLKPFAFTGPTLADGLIISRRMTEEDAAAVVSAITAMSHEESAQDQVLAPFDIEGFTLIKGHEPYPPALRPTRRVEYLAVDLDVRERCQRVWSSTGTAFGRRIPKSEGHLLTELLPSEAGLPLESLARAALHSGVSGRVHFRMAVDGAARLYSAETTLRPPSPTEATPGASLLVRDVTGLQELEQELYRLASFPLLHPEPMLELGREGLRYANPAAHTAFPDLLELGVSHPLVETAHAYLRRSAPGEGPELLQLANRCWEVVATRMQDNESLRVFAKDVTARKQMEANLLHADRMTALGKLAAGVGHQMNNPLAFLMANLSFAREEIGRLREALKTGKECVQLEDVDEVLAALGESMDGAARLKMIVEDFRLLAREKPRHRTRVDVHLVLEDTLKLLRNELHHRARLEKDLEPVPMVEADEARLGQALLNLMLNAVQAMSEAEAARNVLRVATRTGPAGEAIIEVQDTGAGIPAEAMEHLFEPFFTTRPNSMGMGLPISHAIVMSLGGTLRAESQPGAGTLFVLTLPGA